MTDIIWPSILTGYLFYETGAMKRGVANLTDLNIQLLLQSLWVYSSIHVHTLHMLSRQTLLSFFILAVCFVQSVTIRLCTVLSSFTVWFHQEIQVLPDRSLSKSMHIDTISPVAVTRDITANWQLMRKIWSYENQTHLSREFAGTVKILKLLHGFDSLKLNKPCVFYSRVWLTS